MGYFSVKLFQLKREIAGFALKVYDLQQPSFKGMPLHPTHKLIGYTYALHRKHHDTDLKMSRRSGASGVLILTEHAGTHMDALCHQALDYRLHGNVEVTNKIETSFGFSSLGIENVEPIVARGVLLDVARLKGVDALSKFYRISSAELKECCEESEIAPRPGDVVLVRTGYGRFWNDEPRYLEAGGVSLDGARWLASIGVRAVGADNMGFEVDDGTVDMEMGIQLPCHIELLVKNGINIMENVYLEQIAAENIHEFFFVCAPLKLVGATGSPVRPLAISGVLLPS